MQLLVIGASGLIGKEVCKLAKRRNIKVYGTSAHKKIEGLISYDLGTDDPEYLLFRCGMKKQERNTFAVLSGAITTISECYEKREEANLINVVGTCRLARKLHEYGINMIYLSSDAVFDGTRGGWKEEDSPNPLCEYGKQKLQVERYLLSHIPGVLIYRLSKQISPSLNECKLVKDLYLKAQENVPLKCISGLKFQPTDVRDTATCIIEGLLRSISGLYHVANPEIYSRYDLTKLIIDKYNSESKIIECNINEFSFAEPKALDTSMDTKKFQSVLPYKFRNIKDVINEIA